MPKNELSYLELPIPIIIIVDERLQFSLYKMFWISILYFCNEIFAHILFFLFVFFFHYKSKLRGFFCPLEQNNSSFYNSIYLQLSMVTGQD